MGLISGSVPGIAGDVALGGDGLTLVVQGAILAAAELAEELPNGYGLLGHIDVGSAQDVGEADQRHAGAVGEGDGLELTILLLRAGDGVLVHTVVGVPGLQGVDGYT